jgi:hypothetical protein
MTHAPMLPCDRPRLPHQAWSRPPRWDGWGALRRSYRPAASR